MPRRSGSPKVLNSRLSNYLPVPESGCWLWAGVTNRVGYGVINSHGNFVSAAHRFFYTHHKGEIPEGMCVCHKCDTPTCVNPDHLFLGTRADNSRDMFRKGRARPRGTRARRLIKSALTSPTYKGKPL